MSWSDVEAEGTVWCCRVSLNHDFITEFRSVFPAKPEHVSIVCPPPDINTHAVMPSFHQEARLNIQSVSSDGIPGTYHQLGRSYDNASDIGEIKSRWDAMWPAEPCPIDPVFHANRWSIAGVFPTRAKPPSNYLTRIEKMGDWARRIELLHVDIGSVGVNQSLSHYGGLYEIGNYGQKGYDSGNIPSVF